LIEDQERSVSTANLTGPGTQTDASFAAERERQIETFVKTRPEYYKQQFAKIGARAKFAWAFNLWAGVLGPIWFAARGMWNWGLTFLILETFAIVQIVRGLFGDLAAEAWERIAQIEGTLELRRQQLAAAIENSTEKVDVYRRVNHLSGSRRTSGGQDRTIPDCQHPA
jgi:glycine betaine/proline transport system permease protein